MKRVLAVFGTRPEAIKMAPVVHALRERPGDLEVSVCLTGQHREMLLPILDLFKVTGDHDLAIMRPNQTPTDVMAATLTALDPILEAEKPDWVIVQGDTTTAAAAAMAAFHRRIKVGHVEAGLRTGNRHHPFPEEVNRRIVGVIADRHFAPTAEAAENLLREGIAASDILLTGNTVIDAIKFVANTPVPDAVHQLIKPGSRSILVTAHRRENHGPGFERICTAVKRIAEAYPDISIVYPVHMNPAVHKVAHERLGGIPNIRLTGPLEYGSLVHFLRSVDLVLTDSGGIQEEAPGFGKPVLVLRETTERPEGVRHGAAKLVGTDVDLIVDSARELLDNPEAYRRMAQSVNPYGDGSASQRIAASLSEKPVEPFST